MNCPNAPKVTVSKFFGLFTFQIYGLHQWNKAVIKRWGSDRYEFTRHCTLCGEPQNEFGLRREDIVRYGIKLEELPDWIPPLEKD